MTIPANPIPGLTRGVDVSWYQRFFDGWTALYGMGVRFAYVKATEGVQGRDGAFSRHVGSARSVAMRVGAYHFAHAGNVSAQIDNFWAVTGGLGSNPEELPPALDIENSPSRPSLADAQALASGIEERWGCVPVIYGGRDYLGTLGMDAHCPVWLAAYPDALKGGAWPTAQTFWPMLPPWNRPRIWQFSETLPVPGTTTGILCDASVFDGDEAALAAFCAGSRV